MKKVSIIIPIYNAELYLKDCIDSLLNQTYSNVELILINDGSNDNSETICKGYLSDNRVKYFYKQNGGVSSARNFGMEKATGEYFMFVDSDDYVDSEMVSTFLKYKEKYSMVICGYEEIYKNRVFKHSPEKKEINSKQELLNNLLNNKDVCGFLVNKIYDSKVIKENNLLFHEDVHICEDLLFNIEYTKYVHETIIIPNTFYKYRMRKSSATWNLNKDKKNKILKSLEKLDIAVSKFNLESNDYNFFKLQLLYKYDIKNIKNKTKEDYRKIIKCKKISSKNRIKLFIMRNFNFIYKFYMKYKIKNNKLFK